MSIFRNKDFSILAVLDDFCRITYIKQISESNLSVAFLYLV